MTSVIAKLQKPRYTSAQRHFLENGAPDARPWSRSISGYRIFLDLSRSEPETTCLNLDFGSFSRKSTENRARYLYFCEIHSGLSAKHFQLDLSRRCTIKSCCTTARRCSPSLQATLRCPEVGSAHSHTHAHTHHRYIVVLGLVLAVVVVGLTLASRALAIIFGLTLASCTAMCFV